MSDIRDKENDRNNHKHKKKYLHKFSNNWLDRFPWLKSVENRPFCVTCKMKLVGSITHLERHSQSNKHKKKYEIGKTYPKIQTFVENTSQMTLNKNVYSAELKLVMFLHEHNLPFLLMEHLPRLICSVCPDSHIAKNIPCSRTKATAITNECLAKEQLESLQRVFVNEDRYYSVIIDETTDVATKKCLAIIVRFFSEDKVRDKFLGLIQVQSATAEALFNAVKDLLTINKLPTKNILRFAADNAAVMMGQKSSFNKI